MTNFQRLGSHSNARVGSDFEEVVRAYFASQGIHLHRSHSVEVGLNERKKRHKFDLGCDEQKVLVECKAHRWTSGNNIPSAKLTVWNEAMLYFLASPMDYRKILCVIKDHSKSRNETLAQYYLRIYAHLIPDAVEIWEFNETDQTMRQLHPV